VLERRHSQTKTDIVVTNIGIVPVPIRRATVPRIVVPRTTAQFLIAYPVSEFNRKKHRPRLATKANHPRRVYLIHAHYMYYENPGKGKEGKRAKGKES
jgi:hypothetical protein